MILTVLGLRGVCRGATRTWGGTRRCAGVGRPQWRSLLIVRVTVVPGLAGSHRGDPRRKVILILASLRTRIDRSGSGLEPRPIAVVVGANQRSHQGMTHDVLIGEQHLADAADPLDQL